MQALGTEMSKPMAAPQVCISYNNVLSFLYVIVVCSVYCKCGVT